MPGRRRFPFPAKPLWVFTTGAGVVMSCHPAGVKADSDAMWQIGVDVIAPEHGRGVGRALVGRLTELILDRGKIPYYSPAASNIRSRTVATSLGYWPAWTELYARDRQG